MSAEVIADGGRDPVLVCNKVKFILVVFELIFRLVSFMASFFMTERVGDEDFFRALSKVDMFTDGAEPLRKCFSARREIRNQANGSR